LNVGYSDGVGVVGPMTIHGATNCYACHKHDEAGANSHESNEAPVFRYQAPSFGPLNGLVSAIAANEVLKHLGGFGEVASLGRQVRIDPLTLDLEFVDFDIDPECRSCKSLQAGVS
jgi:molybdopterin-synthase adenylyltransferase